MNNICKNCRNKNCEYRNKAFYNMTIFCNENCAAELANNARKYEIELRKLAELENIAGFFGIAKQAQTLLYAANEKQA